jgi:hypothetical protein
LDPATADRQGRRLTGSNRRQMCECDEEISGGGDDMSFWVRRRRRGAVHRLITEAGGARDGMAWHIRGIHVRMTRGARWQWVEPMAWIGGKYGGAAGFCAPGLGVDGADLMVLEWGGPVEGSGSLMRSLHRRLRPLVLDWNRRLSSSSPTKTRPTPLIASHSCCRAAGQIWHHP